MQSIAKIYPTIYSVRHIRTICAVSSNKLIFYSLQQAHSLDIVTGRVTARHQNHTWLMRRLEACMAGT